MAAQLYTFTKNREFSSQNLQKKKKKKIVFTKSNKTVHL